MKKSIILASLMVVLGAGLFGPLALGWVSETFEDREGDVQTRGTQTGFELLGNDVTVHRRDGGTETMPMERYAAKRNSNGKKGLGFDFVFMYALIIGAGLMVLGGGITFARSTIGLVVSLAGAGIVALLMLTSLGAGFFIENELVTDKEEVRQEILNSRLLSKGEQKRYLQELETLTTTRHLGFWLALGMGGIGAVASYVGWSGERTRKTLGWDEDEVADEKASAA